VAVTGAGKIVSRLVGAGTVNVATTAAGKVRMIVFATTTGTVKAAMTGVGKIVSRLDGAGTVNDATTAAGKRD
jgi:hypothetical protein